MASKAAKAARPAMTEVFENGQLVGWYGTTFDRNGRQIKVFIPA